MIVVTITDEFLHKYVFKTENAMEASTIVNDWLTHRDETPIYEINIEIMD